MLVTKNFEGDSRGNLTYGVCLALDKGLDFVHFNDTMKLKNGKFVPSSTKSFSLKDKGTALLSIKRLHFSMIERHNNK